MAAETVTLWTRQVPQVWEELKRTGSYHVKEEYIRMKNDTIADYYLKLYRWYTFEARNYVDIPRELEYPVWLCVSEETMLQPVENTVILKLEIPKDKVALCNMEAWGYVVNYWYVPLDEDDERRHQEELKQYGIREEDELISTFKGNFYPMLKQKIMHSWKRVFTMPPANDNDAVATVWEIKRDWVKEVRSFTGDANGAGAGKTGRKNCVPEQLIVENGAVTMWTAQTQAVLDALERDGISYVKKAYLKKKYGETLWIFETAYDWFIRHLEREVDRPGEAESPVWLFRDAKWAGTGQGAKLIRLEVPVEEILFFDRKKWTEILNLSYVGTNAEKAEFEKEILRRGISDVSDVFASPGYPALKERVMASWERLFDVKGLRESDLQGAVWRLKKEWIKEVEGQENIKK